MWLLSKWELMSPTSRIYACHIFIIDCVSLKMCLPDGFHTKVSDNCSAGPRFEMSYRAWRGRKGESLAM